MPAPTSDSLVLHSTRSPWPLVTLALFIMGVAIGWGWALPQLAQQPVVRQQIEQAERLGINPGALYYTDVFVDDAFAPGRVFRESKSPKRIGSY